MIDILIQSTLVKEIEFFNPNFDEVDYLLNEVIKDCSSKYFHSV